MGKVMAMVKPKVAGRTDMGRIVRLGQKKRFRAPFSLRGRKVRARQQFLCVRLLLPLLRRFGVVPHDSQSFIQDLLYQGRYC
jgi:hypothetical protein